MTSKTKANPGMADLADLEKLTNPQSFKSDLDLGAITKFNQHGDNIDPIIRSIPIHSIDEYAFNPRQADNDHFEAIKESIKEIGLQQIFSVVKNPETKRYTLIKGGNTRLLAFKSLYRETGDTKFSSIDCIVEPWNGELNKTQAVIAHLVENEARGELILVDKAKALIELEQDYKNNGIKSLTTGQTKLENSNIHTTTQEFVEYLKYNGYSVSEKQLGLFRFTATKLTGNLDNFLNQGMGSPQIIKIRSVYNNFKRIVKEAEIKDYSLDALDNNFSQGLKKYNKTRKPFDFEKLLDVLITNFIITEPYSSIFDNNIATFKQELLSTTRKPKEKEITSTENNDSGSDLIQADEVKVDAAVVESDKSDKQESDLADQRTIEPLVDGLNEVDMDNTDALEIRTEGETTVHLDLYRKQAINLVTKITNKLNIPKIVKEIDTGCGFILVDLVDESKSDFEHWGVFWLLLGYSHAADILNPISDFSNFQEQNLTNINEKLWKLYTCVSVKNIEDVDNCLKKINQRSEMYEFRAPNLQSVKDGLVPHMWQDITALESVCYQIMHLVKTGETGFTIWS